MDEQPSPSMVFPSSHYYEFLTKPSPHKVLHYRIPVLGFIIFGKTYPSHKQVKGHIAHVKLAINP